MTSRKSETAPKAYKIMVLQGDHIGPEIMAEVLPLFDLVQSRFNVQIERVERLIGGSCLDQHDCPIQDSTLQEASTCHAVLLGSVGGPKWDVGDSSRRPETGILRMRKHLNLFANVRPAKIIAERQLKLSSLKDEVVRGVNIITLRENAGGIYFGKKQEPDQHAMKASDLCEYTREEVVRLTRVAAALSLANKPEPLPIISVDKANVMATSRLWRQVVTETVRDEYPQLVDKLSHHLVDSAAMVLARDPRKLNGVILTENLFGDILSDLTSVIPGSLGLLGSAEIDAAPNASADGRMPVGVYQPVSGSAPDIAGKGLANPIGMFESFALMCRWSLGLPQLADAIDAAIKESLESGQCTRDVGGSLSTQQAGALLRQSIQQSLS
ncbi:Isopropylmalate dehydrogenase-like domain protein [Kalmanozyma brasiliensis GHG001]|uniref:Isopropylmalate dehydrogenase-like domain protein n=1 Tax=Kalmanozyma brasiliensis (strain GHG001) TaxID=1365824 RepID=UPI001CE7372E|nr:Isopropylmalate dehydrogenase-like domain protein [Kalmanozyma brasiliensis GHG001]EST08400.2 Isopropylmalate dehydrogenase-like domain protein [Kalmanozyma brasiliensis GHG001]